jgi:hypothetical protein
MAQARCGLPRALWRGYRAIVPLACTLLVVAAVPGLALGNWPPIGHIAGFGVSRSCCDSSFTVYGRTLYEKAYSARFQYRRAGAGEADWHGIGSARAVTRDSTLWAVNWNPCVLDGEYELRVVLTDSLGDDDPYTQPILHVEIDGCQAVPTGPSVGLANGGFEDRRAGDLGLIHVYTDAPELWHSAIAVWSYPIDSPDGDTIAAETVDLKRDLGDQGHYVGAFEPGPMQSGATGTFWFAYSAYIDWDSNVTYLSSATLAVGCGIEPELGFPFCFENRQICARVCIDPGALTRDDGYCLALFPSEFPRLSLAHPSPVVWPNCAPGNYATAIRWNRPSPVFETGKYAEVQISYRSEEPEEALGVMRWDSEWDSWTSADIIIPDDGIKDGIATFYTRNPEGIYSVVSRERIDPVLDLPVEVRQDPELTSHLEIRIPRYEWFTDDAVLQIIGDTSIVMHPTDDAEPGYAAAFDIPHPGPIDLEIHVFDRYGRFVFCQESFDCFAAGPSESSVKSRNGQFALTIPAGSFTNERMLLLFEHSDAEWNDYEIRPDGANLAGPAKVQITCDATTLAELGTRRLGIHRRVGGDDWEPLPTALDGQVGALVAYTDRLGEFQIRPDGPALAGPLPRSAELRQNYPNPFNDATVIEFSLEYPRHVTLEVLNILGQRVTTLLNEDQTLGTHRVEWDGTNSENTPVATGVYFYRLTTDSYVETRAMLLLR